MSKETLQEKTNKIIQNVDKFSAEHLPTLRKGLKLARENAKTLALTGAAIATIGGVDKFLVEKSKDSVNLPVVAESLAKANTYGQGYKAATDFIKQGKKEVSTTQYYEKVAKEESTDSIKPPDTTKTIAKKLENNSDSQNGSSATVNVLKERSSQKINLQQSETIQQSATKFEQNQDNRQGIDNILITAGIVAGSIGSLSGLRMKKGANKEEISSDQVSDTNKYFNQIGQEIVINDGQLFEVDNLPTITDLEKKADETPRFQNRIDRLNRIEGQDPTAQKFMKGLIDSIGVSYTALDKGDRRKGQLKKFIDDALNSYTRQVKIGTKINALNLSNALRKSFKDEIPQIIKIAINEGLKQSVRNLKN
jgi:hypothetical protein